VDDIVDGEANDAAERLCVEQDDSGRDASSEWQVVVGQEAAEQLYPVRRRRPSPSCSCAPGRAALNVNVTRADTAADPLG
jgi:hypothetical protein